MQARQPILSDKEFQALVINNSHTPALLIQNYIAHYDERKCNIVFDKLKDLLIDVSVTEIYNVLKQVLDESFILHEDFVLSAIKHILGHKHSTEALLEIKKENQSLYDRYMKVAPLNEQMFFIHNKVKILLNLAKSIHEMKQYGESVINDANDIDPVENNDANENGNDKNIIDTANQLREQIPQLDLLTKEYVFDGNKEAQTKFNEILHANDQIASHNPDWAIVSFKVAFSFDRMNVLMCGNRSDVVNKIKSLISPVAVTASRDHLKKDIHDVLKQLLAMPFISQKDFVLPAVKYLLTHELCAEVLFEKQSNGQSLYDSYKKNNEVKKFLNLAKSIYKMEKYGERIKQIDPKGKEIIDTAIQLREKIPTLVIGANGNKKNAEFKRILHEKDEAFGRHRGWKRVALNVGACLAGLGIFYAIACFNNYRKTNHKRFFLFGETKTEKKVKKVDKAFNAIAKRSNV